MAQVRSQGPSVAPAPVQALPSKITAQIDLLVSLHLWSWPALTLAVQNGWGGSQQVSTDKRDWLAGAVSELLTSNPPQLADVADLEEVLLQVMVDEFEIVVDDGTAQEVASKIWTSAQKVQAGDVKELEELYKRWQQNKAEGGDKVTGIVRGEDKDGEETDWDEEDEDEDEWNGIEDKADVDMAEAPELAQRSEPKPKPVAEVDEEGFTKVVSKKRK